MLLVTSALSAAVHVAVGIPLQGALPRLLAPPIKDRPAQEPVRVVRLTPEAFERTLSEARRLAPKKTRPVEPKEQPKKPEAKKEKEKNEERPSGQVVEVPSSGDRRPPDSSKYLAREDSRVERETVARKRDETKKQVTNKVQDTKPMGGPEQGLPVPGMKAEGDGKSERDGEPGEGNGEKRRLSLDVPRIARRDGVQIDPRVLSPGRVLNREATEAVPGRADRLRLGGDPEGGDAGGERRGDKGNKPGLPSLRDLRPTLGTVARIAGSPSDDYIENVPEGEGTFLNTRSFKYATFFYQVRDSVGGFWRGDIRREMRRRDPTGDVYGFGDFKTLLYIRLNENGGLNEVKVAESSGHDFLDTLAVRAFEKAGRFPNPPKGIVDPDGQIKFHFAFVLTAGRRGPLDLFR